MTAASGIGAHEINGDGPLRPVDRLRYLGGNLWRNATRRRAAVTVCRWPAPGRAQGGAAVTTSSPLRLVSEAFIREALPRLRPPGEVAVLDIGCGSGRLAALLAAAGYSGRYTGIDTANRFAGDTLAGPAFRARFVEGDAHAVPLAGPYDLILSMSALEHIVDDTRLIARLAEALSQDGMQLHIVPAPAALPLYLWHGFRQYGTAALADRFRGEGVRLYALGGAASWLLHFLWITLPETLMKTRPRAAFPRLYAALLHRALRLDARLPLCPLGYAAVSPPRAVRAHDRAGPA